MWRSANRLRSSSDEPRQAGSRQRETHATIQSMENVGIVVDEGPTLHAVDARPETRPCRLSIRPVTLARFTANACSKASRRSPNGPVFAARYSLAGTWAR